MLKDNRSLRIATYFDWANIAALITFAIMSFLDVSQLAKLICFGIITLVNLLKGTLTAIGITNNENLTDKEKRHTFLSSCLSAFVNVVIAGIFLGLALSGNNIIATIGFPLILTVTTIGYWFECYFNNETDPHGETTSRGASLIIFLACLALLAWTLTDLFKPQAIGTIFAAPAWPLVTAFIGIAIFFAKISYDWKGVFPESHIVTKKLDERDIYRSIKRPPENLEAGFHVIDEYGNSSKIITFCDKYGEKLNIDTNTGKIYYPEESKHHKKDEEYKENTVYDYDAINMDTSTGGVHDGNFYKFGKSAIVEDPTKELITYNKLNIPASFDRHEIFYKDVSTAPPRIFSFEDMEARQQQLIPNSSASAAVSTSVAASSLSLNSQ
ncbi:MAG: hypothetical protein M1561_02640 [Gammaproteobacteria bacterium]|nr:hypothetical protein [Gammaproteobacteria bacterium]